MNRKNHEKQEEKEHKKNSKYWLLIDRLMPDSKAQNWEEAKTEWKILYTYDAEEDSTCLCGHYPIKEIYVIENTQTRIQHEIGNVCINHLFEAEAKIAAGLKKIRKEPDKSTTPELVYRAYTDGVINAWEYNFYRDTQRKQLRGMSPKQRQTRYNINQKIYSGYLRHRGMR